MPSSATYSIWQNVPFDEKNPAKIAFSIQYKLEDLKKLMPSFVQQLKVPLIALADSSKPDDQILFEDLTPSQHFKNEWKFSKKGFTLKDRAEDDTDVPEFMQTELHTMLQETKYSPREFFKDDDDERTELVKDMSTYHLVKTCVPSNYSITDCSDNGYLMVVVG